MISSLDKFSRNVKINQLLQSFVHNFAVKLPDKSGIKDI